MTSKLWIFRDIDPDRQAALTRALSISPATAAEVSDAIVDAYFQPLPPAEAWTPLPRNIGRKPAPRHPDPTQPAAHPSPPDWRGGFARNCAR